jgi:MFS superfamily sulfate permease-like transporter
MTAFAAVVLLGVLLGIVVAITLSVANVFRRTWWPYQATLGRRPGIAGYHDVARHPDAEQLAGCTIFRFDAPLIFANARTFCDQVLALAKASRKPAWIIVAAEPLTDVDTTAADMLEDLVTDLDQQAVTLVFAEMKGPVKEKARQFGLGTRIPDYRFFRPWGRPSRPGGHRVLDLEESTMTEMGDLSPLDLLVSELRHRNPLQPGSTSAAGARIVVTRHDRGGWSAGRIPAAAGGRYFRGERLAR